MRRRRIILSVAVQLVLSGCVTSNPDFCVSPDVCGNPDDVNRRDLAMEGVDSGPLDNPDMTTGKGDMSMESGLDLSKKGPLSTVRFDLKVNVNRANIDLTVIGPSTDGKEITKTGAPFPWVLLSPGFSTDHKQYQGYGDRLASYGIVTVLQKSPNEFDHARYRDDSIALISWLVNPMGMGGERLAGRLDKDRIGVVGHSLGGKISLLVAESDSRIKAIFGIDPVDQRDPQAVKDIGKIKLPSGFPIGYVGETVSQTGGMPCAPANANYEVLFKAGPSPAFAITVVDAAHMDFVDNPSMCWNCGFCRGGTAPKERTNQLAIKYTTAYFLATLGGDRRAVDTLSGMQFQKDATAGFVTRVAK